ncbi:hypothetical protein KDA_31540 [Dictyobacter alpinus]|uniref:Uncharacterized protein n=1 Tax=Dictyobacter alpinus TaxID=2014873 RepID=A0A402B8P5_9CHLR|nr:hypothetical protein [Dictyobacter alpinus]GCE27670.1 hypothetical protein KDA_31540 [Dictyobacter alpinus]
MTGPEYLEHIAQLLLQYGIIQKVTAEMKRHAGEELHRHATGSYLQRWEVSSACLLETLRHFLPEAPQRLVWFDAEMDDSAYEDLVRRFAAATSGEWSPEQVEYSVNADKNVGDFHCTLDVDVRGAAIHGEWTTPSLKWVANDFLDLIEHIAQTHLSGGFVAIPMHDQTMLFAYLPHSCVRDLAALLDLLEHQYPDFVTFAHTF